MGATYLRYHTAHLVDHLPLDQVWLWASTAACNYRAGMLIAVSQAGDVQQFDTPVVAVVERLQRAPIVITCAADGHFALVDTATWATVPLALAPGTLLQNFLASTNGMQVAFSTIRDSANNDGRKSTYQLQIADIATGTTRMILDGDQLLSNPKVDYIGDVIEPIAWHDSLLYTHTQASASSVFWRIDTAQSQPSPDQILVIGETGLWASTPSGTALVWSYIGNTPQLRQLQTGRDEPLDRVIDAAITPDGTILAAIRTTATGVCCELSFADLTPAQPHLQATSIKLSPLIRIQGQSSMTWSPDGQRLIIATERPRGQGVQALIVNRNGTLVATIPLPYALQERPRILNNNSLLLPHGNRLYSMPLNPKTPAVPDAIELPATDSGVMYSIVYAPTTR